jgi:polyphosphate kinase
VRLEISAECPDELESFLRGHFELEPEDVYRIDGPVNLSRFQTLYDLLDRPDLKYRPFVPGVPEKVERSSDYFELLRDRDVLLHHPFQSFGPVIAFLRQAAADPDVLAIKQTVYRTGMESTIGAILLDAARAGKEVTAVVELRARYDEATNIDLATRLQEAGAKVVYGIVGFKAHAKMLLVVRREGAELRRYVHLGTGNYNEKTARAYTDLSLLTADTAIAEDVHAVFQQLTGLGKVTGLKKLLQTPFGLHERLIELIDREALEATNGGKARIIAKMNSLTEPRIIAALYRASCAGVKIDLIIRGTCCLRPGVPGASENIRVRSIVGRFLEHHRVFYFHARGEEVFLASSADWMPRNFFRRVEVAFPLEGKKARRRVMLETLSAYLEDNVQAYEMLPDGSYMRLVPGPATPVSAQERLLAELCRDGITR